MKVNKHYECRGNLRDRDKHTIFERELQARRSMFLCGGGREGGGRMNFFEIKCIALFIGLKC